MLRNVADNYVVVPMGKEAADFNGMITLNETGAFMWKCLEKGCTKEELVAKVLEEYEAEKEQVRLSKRIHFARRRTDSQQIPRP